MSAREIVLALDQGSSSSRVLAFDRKGRVVARAARPVKTFRPREGWAEHDPAELARSLDAALDDVLARLPASARVIGAGLACQRSTVVFWDRATLKPAARAPSWMDGRAADIVSRLSSRREEVFARTGLALTPYYSAPKIRWFLDRVPSVRALADAGRLAAAPVASFLVARWTKGALTAVDPTLAQRTLLLNLETLEWDESLRGLFGLSRELLAAVRPTMGDWGTIERGGRRIPILAVVGDQQAAAAGLGAREPGAAVANYGTGAFLLAHRGPRADRVAGLLTTVGARREGAPPAYFQEGTVHAAGASFEWLASLGLMRDPGRIDVHFRRSSRPVWALPAIGGLGAPRWDYRTKTVWFGMTAKTTASDIVRGTAEGLCFLMSEIAETLRGGGVALGPLRVAGGLARSAGMMAFQADLLGVPLERRRETEATALGVASLAAEAAGAPWAAAMTDSPVEKVFEPRISAEESARRRGEWTRFVAAQTDLSRAISLS